MKKILNFEEFNENYRYYLEDGDVVTQVSKDEFIQKFGPTYEPKRTLDGKGFSIKIENDKVFGTM